MVNKTSTVHNSHHLRGQVFRLTLVQRNFVTLVQKHLEVIDDPITLPSRLACSLAFFQ
jgi:hypothetical protein